MSGGSKISMMKGRSTNGTSLYPLGSVNTTTAAGSHSVSGHTTENQFISTSTHAGSGHMTDGRYISGDIQLLGKLNSEEIQRLVPLIVYLMLISLVGIPGNGIVYHIYRTQYKRSNIRYFIICLSAIDFFTCMFVIPFELFTVMNQYTYSAEIACKVARFCNSTPTVASGFMFLLIAIDRYRKVCQPLGWQIRPRMARVLCFCMIGVGVFLSWPALWLYGKKTFPVEGLSLNATECSTTDSISGTIYPFVYNSMIGFLFIVGTTSLVTLYAIIGRAISQHAKDIVHFQSSVELKTLRNDSYDDNPDLSNTMDDAERSSKLGQMSLERKTANRATISSSVDDGSDVFVEDGGTQSGAQHSTAATLDRPRISVQRAVSFDTIERSPIYKKTPSRSISHESKQNPKQNGGASNGTGVFRKLSSIGSRFKPRSKSDTDTTTSTQSVSQKRRQRMSRKMSLIMFLITLAYIVSYLPHVSLMMARAINREFVESMGDGERAVYKLFLRSYFLNCIVNPFIYSACDTRFRNAIKQLVRCSK